MRLGLTAQLCLLTTTLVLGTTLTAAYLFRQGAQTAVRERELDDLRAATELRGRQLLADLERARADLLALAAAPATRAALRAPAGDADAAGHRTALQRTAAELLRSRERTYYLQLAFVRNDAAGSELLSVGRDRAGAGPRVAAAGGAWAGRAEFEPARRLAAPRVAFSEVRRAAAGNDLEQTALAAVPGPDGDDRPAGFVVLRLDFGLLTRRLNDTPGVLGFLARSPRPDGQVVYLAHPDRDRVLTAAPPDDRARPLDTLLLDLHGDTAGPGDPAALRTASGLSLPGLEFYLTTCRFDAIPDAGQLEALRADLLARYPGLRLGEPAGGRMLAQAADPAQLDAALRECRDRLPGARPEWDEPFVCRDFLAGAYPLRLELPPARAGEAPAVQWYGLGLVRAREQDDRVLAPLIAAAARRNMLLALALAGVAAAATLLFALYLTRPLRRMTAFAERVAAGQEADLELPPYLGQDEIGTLARAFAHMVEQVRLRTLELRESEARIRTILSTAAEGIVTIDEKGHLESFNLAAERLFGYSAPEVRGQHFTKLLQRGAPADMPTLLGVTSLTASRSATESSLMSITRVNGTTREALARRRDGKAFPIEMSVSEVILGDRLVYTAIIRDVTERKQAEAKIQQMNAELEHRVQERTAELRQANQALESARDLALEANRAKDAFLAVMSHELRTPLNAIIGYCDYWLHEADEHDPQEMLDDLRKVHISGKHLLALINDILDLAKIQAGRMTLELTEFDLPPLLTELREWVEPLVRKNANALALEIADDLGAMRADRIRVRQVLLNLLSNAAKFTTDGVIRLQALRETHGGREEIVFRVADTGCGMKPEDVKRLFQPFVQVDSSSTRKHEGTGLGLAICRRLCELMGGVIEVHSELGVGTTFTVRLPARVAPPELPGARRDGPAAAPAPPAAEAPLVLVVDDHPGVRSLLEKVLTQEGYRVRTAPGGAAGLAMARRERPAAVVLDALMRGGVDGWSVLSALKSDPATADVPVILATIVDGQTRGFALAATDYVTKPIDFARLGVVLRAYRAARPDGPALVIDDDPAARELIARHLTAQGWEVLEAANGREGLERLRQRRPAVILLDLLMPEMDGFTFAGELRQSEAWGGIPVVVVTAADLSAADRERLSGLVQRVLQKGDFTPEQLLAEVRARVQECVVRRPSEPAAEPLH